MSVSITVFNGIALGLMLLLPLAYPLSNALQVLGAAAICVGLVVLNCRRRQRGLYAPFSLRNPNTRLVLVTLGGMLLLRATHSMVQYYEIGATTLGLGLVFWTAAESSCFAAIAVGMGRKRPRDLLMVLGIGFGVYCGVNVLLFNLGFQNPHPDIAGVRLELPEAVRMLPPFAKSTTNFGAYAAIGAGCTVVALLYPKPWAQENLKSLWFLLPSLGVALFSAWSAQVRFGLLAVMFAMVWVVLPKTFWRNILGFAVLAGMIVLPFCFIDLAAVALTDRFMPSVLLDYLSRREGELMYLGGRAFVFDYGFDLLFSGKLGLVGMGPVLRDATPALAEWSPQLLGVGSNASFHNGYLEILVAHGPVLSTLFFTGLVVSILRLARTPRKSPEAENFRSLDAAGWREVGVFVVGLVSIVATVEVVFNEVYGLLTVALALYCGLEHSGESGRVAIKHAPSVDGPSSVKAGERPRFHHVPSRV